MQSKLQLTSLAALAHVFYTNVFARSRGTRSGEKAEGWSHLNLSSLLSLRAIPASWLALQKTIGAVLFPGRKHLGQVIKAAVLGGRWLHRAFNSTFILSLPVNSQTSHHGLFHTGASPERVLQPQNVLLRGLGCGQQCSPKLTTNPGTFGAPMMVPGHCQSPGLVLEPSLEETFLFPQPPHTALLQLSSFTFPNTLSQTKR